MPDATPVEPLVTPAPAPEPIPTAVEQAVAANDVPAYREARRAERLGKPLEPTADDATTETEPDAVVAAPLTATEPARTLSKRQQDINDRIRAAVDTATADLRAENARLKAPVHDPTPPTPARSAAPSPDDPEPDPADTATYPDGQFDRKFMKDLGAWGARQALAQHDAHQRASAAEFRRDAETHERVLSYSQHIDKALQADPDFLVSITPELANAVPISVLPPNAPRSVLNAIAEEVLRSENPPALLRYLTDKPEELAHLKTLRPGALLKAIGRIEGTFASPSTPAAKLITSATPPPTTLGRKTVDTASATDAAVVSGDVAAYRKARLAERLAGQR